jgi:hypothetical protein
VNFRRDNPMTHILLLLSVSLNSLSHFGGPLQTVPYTSCNGHMFSYLSKEGALNLRLPAAERQSFLKKYKTRLCEAYGVVQPEYVVVPDSLLEKTSEPEAHLRYQLRVCEFTQAEGDG